MSQDKFNFSASINDAVKGSMDAYNFLYRKSLPIFEKQVYEYCSNPADVEDILQDAYVKIFSSLDKLQNADNFIAWGKQICRNEAINAGKKKKAKKNDYVLMPESTDDEESMGLEDISADTYATEFNPEAKVDADETQRLMNDMLGELSENQRLVIGMWKDQYTFKEIAEELDMPENTVKSHFNRGKKALEAKVRDLEKQGTKLYSMAPFVFFLWIVGQFDQSFTPDIPSEVADPVLQEVVRRLPDHLIKVGKSTPKSIEKYGTEAMKREADQLPEGAARDISRDGNASGQDTNHAPEGADDSEANNWTQTEQMQPEPGEIQVPQYGTQSQGQNQTQSSAEGTVSSQAPKGTAATHAGRQVARMSGAARGIIAAAVVVVVGVGALVGYHLSQNQQSPETVSTEAQNEANEPSEPSEPTGNITKKEVEQPSFTPEEASAMSSQELATALQLDYIGNDFTMSEVEITDIPSGCLSACSQDFDGDGSNEILTVEIEPDGGSANIGVVMYKLDGNQWVRAGERLEEIPSWSSLKDSTDSDGNPDGDQGFYYHVLGDEIFVSDTSLIYDLEAEATSVTFDGSGFQEGDLVNYTQREIFDDGGCCLAGGRFSYYNTDFTYERWPQGFEESFAVDLIDFTDMSTYTIGDYEFSYPKYFDDVGIEMVAGTAWTNKDSVAITLINDDISIPSGYEGDYDKGSITVNYLFNGSYSGEDFWDAVVFWKSGDDFWAYEEGDGWAVNLGIMQNSDAFSLFHLYNIAYVDSEVIYSNFHSLVYG